jgi:hypothetical protein
VRGIVTNYVVYYFNLLECFTHRANLLKRIARAARIPSKILKFSTRVYSCTMWPWYRRY